MITLLTTAKPFVGESAVRQRNALGSWKRLHADVEILLIGEGEGYEQVAKELGLIHVPDVERNACGTPLVRGLFAVGRARGRHELQCLINCDIVLFGDFIDAANRLKAVRQRFLMVGERWDLDLREALAFGDSRWAENLKLRTRSEGRRLGAHGIDYFLYRGADWTDIPPLAIARTAFDNWLIYYSRTQSISVIDASDVVTAVHENHDYSHLPGGKTEAFGGAEVQENVRMVGGLSCYCTIADADWRLTPAGLVRNHCRGDAKRCVALFGILHPHSRLARSPFVQFLLEVGYELAERCGRARRGDFMPILKFLPWLFCRAFGRR